MLRMASLRMLAVAVLLSFSGTISAQVEKAGSTDDLMKNIESISSPQTSTSRSGAFKTNDPFGSNTDTSANKGIEYHVEIPDSILRQKVFIFRYRPTQNKIYQVWHPSLDPTGAQFHDPLDAFNGNYYLGKGVIGQPHIGLYPTFADGLYYRLQAPNSEGYDKRKETIRFYQTATPYTLLSYQSSLNKDYQVHVAHTQNIKPGWNVSLDYHLMCPDGVYTNSGTKNHYLDATTNYFSPDARLQVQAGLIRQEFTIGENGGLTDDSYFTEQKQTNRAGIPVVLYDAATHQLKVNAFASASYNLVRQFESYRSRDSIAPHFENDSVTRIDTIEVIDTIPIRQPRTLNLGVFGIDLNHDRQKRVLIDSTFWREHSLTLYWTNDAYMDHRWRNPLKITVGITPRIINTYIEGDTLQSWSWLNPFAKVVIALGRSSLTGEGQLSGAFGNEVDYRLAATWVMPFDSARNTVATLSAVAQRQCPDIRMLHDANVHQNIDINSIATERYEFSFRHSEYIDFQARATHLSHNLWYDEGMLVHQGTQDLWLFQGSLTLRLHADWLHYDMQQQLQHSTDEEQLPVPLWTTKNSLYADILLFHRALRAQIGVDLRYLTAFRSPNYDPYTGCFFQQNTTVGDYIWADAFINIQVKRAVFYIKGGHFNALWESTPKYMLLPHYPGMGFGLYWGLTWQFFD